MFRPPPRATRTDTLFPNPTLSRSLAAVSGVSGEAASALALGPDFNHVTISVRAAGFADIETMADAMRAAGFRLLPAIQGAPGTALRQTATMAATMDTSVLEADGRIDRKSVVAGKRVLVSVNIGGCRLINKKK